MLFSGLIRKIEKHILMTIYIRKPGPAKLALNSNHIAQPLVDLVSNQLTKFFCSQKEGCISTKKPA
jgi:hypothetical protein